jgi:hypothetical protein
MTTPPESPSISLTDPLTVFRVYPFAVDWHYTIILPLSKLDYIYDFYYGYFHGPWFDIYQVPLDELQPPQTTRPVIPLTVAKQAYSDKYNRFDKVWLAQQRERNKHDEAYLPTNNTR